MCLTNHLETGLRCMPSQSVTRLPPLITGLALICQGFLLKLGSTCCSPHGPAWEGLVAQGPSTVMVNWYCYRLTTTVNLSSEPGHPASPSIHMPAPLCKQKEACRDIGLSSNCLALLLLALVTSATQGLKNNPSAIVLKE